MWGRLSPKQRLAPLCHVLSVPYVAGRVPSTDCPSWMNLCAAVSHVGVTKDISEEVRLAQRRPTGVQQREEQRHTDAGHPASSQ